MPRAPHPSEAHEQAVLAGAVTWTAFLQVRPGDRRSEAFGTRGEAEAYAAKLADEMQRPIMVYGVNREGRSALAGLIRPNGAKVMSEAMAAEVVELAPAKKTKGPKAKAMKAEAAKEIAKAVAAPKSMGKRAQADADAAAGKLPKAPDFSAETHKRFRPRLEELQALVADADIAGLEAVKINPVSSSPKALARYRDLAVIALKARAAA